MIWLSSFPESGDVLYTKVLSEIYGVQLGPFYIEGDTSTGFSKFPITKTHLLPEQLPTNGDDIKAIYLVRDGRDALIAMTYQHKKYSEEKFKKYFIEAMVAAEGSYFGGWSVNAGAWIHSTDILVRFEDLITSPIAQVERLSPIFKLEAKSEAETSLIVEKQNSEKAYGWKLKLDRELQNYFWSYHRNMMDQLGYDRKGGITSLNPDFDHKVMQLLGQPIPKPTIKYKVLIEANKLLMHQNDGVKRYLLELLKALHPVALNENSHWDIDVFIKGRVHTLEEFGKTLFDASKNENHYNKSSKVFKGIKKSLKVFLPKSYHETFSKNFRRVLMKMGLKFAKTIARFYYVVERVKSGKEVARENFESQLGALEMGKYDLVHVPLPQHYEPFVGTKNNYLVTIHDLTHKLYSEYHTDSNVQVAESGLQYFQAENSEYLCISEATKKDLLDVDGMDESKMHIVYEAADSQKFRPNLNETKGQFVRGVYGISDKPFLFTLSTLEPRKNLLNTIKAFELLLDENPELDINLVIGGKNGWKSKDLMRMKHMERIIFTGFIDENDLPILYTEAEALCYVSFYEGFGLPPLEAMSCKTPVIYGDNSSMKELFEGYGLPANPDDVVGIKNQMKKIITDTAFRKELAEISLERTFDFSWRKTAVETLSVYEKVIDKNKA